MAITDPLGDDGLAKEGYMEIAEQIKAGRARLGLTQDELAQKVYVSRQTISSWENNKTYPDVQSLMLLSQTFGISIDDLVKGDVTRMKERLEQDVKTLNSYGVGITLTVVAATIAIFATTWQGKHGWSLGQQIPTMLIAVIACIVLAYCVAKTERIKHDHDLQTFREISDFMDGKTPGPDTEVPKPERRGLSGTIKFLIAGAVGFAVFELLSALFL